MYLNGLSIKLRCLKCFSSFSTDPLLFLCPKCRLPLEVKIRFSGGIDWASIRGRPLGVWRYRELLPLPKGAEVVTMGEGGTPLIKSVGIAREYGVTNLHFKFEGSNPTGSFKDRGMTLAVSLAKYLGFKAVVVASTGNTSASAAAYARRAGLKCVVVLPKGKVAKGKLAQAILYGADIVEVEGAFDVALEAVIESVMELGTAYPLNSFNPWRLEGQKTIAYEIYDQLGFIPDNVVVPVGNAGNISAIWKGFKELRELGVVSKLPRMYGVQAKGASPLVKLWGRGGESLIPEESPETVATAIRIGKPINWLKALRAVNESGGAFVSVTDEEILQAQRELARLDGLATEPAGAASVAGVKKLINQGFIERDEVTVAVITGHGLKDPDSMASCSVRVITTSSLDEAVSTIMKLCGGGQHGGTEG